MIRRTIYELVRLGRVLEPVQFAMYMLRTATTAFQVLRTRSLAAVDAKMSGSIRFKTWRRPLIVDFQAIDVAVLPDRTHTFSQARELCARGVYFRAFHPFDAHGKTVLDIGANRGLFTALACAALEPAKIISVEPQKMYRDAYALLTEHYADDVECILINALAGGEPQEAGKVLKPAPIVDINALTADEACLAFVKIDIEGAEEKLFSANTTWLARVERLAMEVHPRSCDASIVHDSLRRAGLTVLHSDPLGGPTSIETAEFFYAARNPVWLKQEMLSS